MKELIKKLKARNRELFTEIVDLRRKIHQNPELSFEEFQTSQLVVNYLKSIGLNPVTGIAKTGVVAYIYGKKKTPVVALRADMDALPIQEKNKVAYASKNPGKMHACGHDFHTSSLLATAKLLTENKDSLQGTVKLIFQPSEERIPGGASVMIEEGVLKDVDVILGQHAMPLIDVGKTGIRPGRYMASSDEIYITVNGKGGHGAQPHTTIDPVSIAAQALSYAQQIVSRRNDPRLPSVLTFGKVSAQGATNIIPDKVLLEGTFRTFNENWRAQAHTLIKDVFEKTAEAFGAKADVEIRKGYPVLFNDPKVTALVRKGMEIFLGKENIEELELWMASEDFAYYTHQVPGCFYRTGIRNRKKGIVSHLHTPTFDIDENVLAFAPALMAYLGVLLAKNWQ